MFITKHEPFSTPSLHPVPPSSSPGTVQPLLSIGKVPGSVPSTTEQEALKIKQKQESESIANAFVSCSFYRIVETKETVLPMCAHVALGSLSWAGDVSYLTAVQMWTQYPKRRLCGLG